MSLTTPLYGIAATLSGTTAYYHALVGNDLNAWTDYPVATVDHGAFYEGMRSCRVAESANVMIFACSHRLHLDFTYIPGYADGPEVTEVYRSTDSGATWSLVLGPLGTYYNLAEPKWGDGYSVTDVFWSGSKFYMIVWRWKFWPYNLYHSPPLSNDVMEHWVYCYSSADGSSWSSSTVAHWRWYHSPPPVYNLIGDADIRFPSVGSCFVDADGGIHLILAPDKWFENAGSMGPDSPGHYYYYSADGSSWSAAVRLDTDSYVTFYNGARLYASDGHIYAWFTTSGVRKLYVSHNSGASWASDTDYTDHKIFCHDSILYGYRVENDTKVYLSTDWNVAGPTWSVFKASGYGSYIDQYASVGDLGAITTYHAASGGGPYTYTFYVFNGLGWFPVCAFTDSTNSMDWAEGITGVYPWLQGQPYTYFF